METKKEIKFTLKFSSINVIKFSQYDVSDFTIKDEDFIEYENNFEIRVFDDTKEIGLLSTTKLKVLEINEIFCELKLLSKFRITNFDEVIIKKSEESFDIPQQIIKSFATIVIGTVRGILHEKLKGTVLQNEVFPLVDLKDFKVGVKSGE